MESRKGIRAASDEMARALARAKPRHCHCPPPAPPRPTTGEQLISRSNRLKIDLMHLHRDGETEILCDFEVHGSFEFRPDGNDTEAAALLRHLLRDFRTAERVREGGEANGC